jgi:outer membrane biosynthesis protein TonB
MVAQAPAPSAAPLAARANLQSYFSPFDYPAAAQRAREEGTAAFRLTVGPNGRVIAELDSELALWERMRERPPIQPIFP